MPARPTRYALFLATVGALVAAAACAQSPAAGNAPASATQPDAGGAEYLEDSAENINARAMLDRAMVTIAGGHTLSDVLDSLRDQSHMNFTINWVALQAAGIDKKMPVDLTLTNVSLANALRILLNETGIDYLIDDGIIVVSTTDDLSAAKYWSLCMFNVRDLVNGPLDNTPPGPTTTAADADSVHPDAVNLAQVRDDRINSLVDTIKATIDPASWRDAGGTVGSIRELDNVLIVNQTNENQRGIAHLLALLRTTLARRAAAAGPADLGKAGAIREFDGILIITQTYENQATIARFFAQLRATLAAGAQPATQPAPR